VSNRICGYVFNPFIFLYTLCPRSERSGGRGNSVWIVHLSVSPSAYLSVYLFVIPSRFVKNGNIFEIKSDILTKLAPLMYLMLNHIPMVINAPWGRGRV